MKTEFSQKMTCYNPKPAWYSDGPHIDTGKRYLVFTCPFPCRARFTAIEVPCTKCLGCRLDHSRDWAVRCHHEMSLNMHNSFLTLTYNDENLPTNSTLVKSHFQKFMKRLRKANNEKTIRYFMCGEYGSQLHRPHYHCLLFNHDFDDKLPFTKTNTDHVLYNSETLDKIWGKGHCQIGTASFESAGYISRYILKKDISKLTPEQYAELKIIPEYIDMSRRPGIAKPWYDKFSDEVTNNDHVIIDGKRRPTPKYYDRLLQKANPLLLEDLKALRKEHALLHEADNTTERLAVREAILIRKAEFLQRNPK